MADFKNLFDKTVCSECEYPCCIDSNDGLHMLIGIANDKNGATRYYCEDDNKSHRITYNEEMYENRM